MKPESLLEDHEFIEKLNLLLANAVHEAISSRLPVRVSEAAWICRAHAVQFRVDFTRGGQDICMSRLNLYTDKDGNVVRMHLG